VGVIQGGVATNVVTDLVQLKAEARSHDTKFRLQIARAFEKAFTKAARQVRSADGRRGRCRFDGALDYESFCLARSEACVREAAAAVRAEGLEPENEIADGGLDANWLTEAGIPTVSLGCGQRDIHTVREQLDIAEFHRAQHIAWRLATANY
jgi:tripeptide aminopeptidase